MDDGRKRVWPWGDKEVLLAMGFIEPRPDGTYHFTAAGMAQIDYDLKQEERKERRRGSKNR